MFIKKKAFLNRLPIALLAVLIAFGALILFQWSGTPCAHAAAECPVGARTVIGDDLVIEFGTAFDVVLTGNPTADRTLEFPNVSSTLVAASSTESLTNKTLVAPTIGATDFTNATHAHTSAATGGDLSYLATVRAEHSANQSMASGSDVTLAFDQETYDTDTMHDTVTNNERLTATTAGKYIIGCQVSITGNGNGTRYIQLRLNGTTTIGVAVDGAPVAGNTGLVAVSMWDMVATDYVTCVATQTSGSTLNALVEGTNQAPVFWMALVARAG